jgi:hypothetical protein
MLRCAVLRYAACCLSFYFAQVAWHPWDGDLKKLEEVDGARLSRIVQDSWEQYPSTWVRKGGVNDPLVTHLLIPLQQMSKAGAGCWGGGGHWLCFHC